MWIRDGGLKLVFLDKTYEFNEISWLKKCIFKNVGSFIPIKMSIWHKVPWMLVPTDLELAPIINQIFENKYLRYKNKYVLLDGVVEKVQCTNYKFEEKKITYNLYQVIKE